VLLPQRLSHLRLPAGMQPRARELLARVGIQRPEQLVGTMSRGQMQRVAVARALVGRPGLIVADEPTASLDAESGAAVADLLVELAQEAGSTLIVASHDSRLIQRMGRTLRLENGRLAA
jgi:putative ABC transport system ATP-binding protein